MLEIDFARDKPAVAGDQFGRGKKRCPAPRLGRHKGRPYETGRGGGTR